MDLGIAGTRALVLGGSKGLGRGIAEALANEGVTVALTGRDAASAAKVASDIGPSARATRSTSRNPNCSTDCWISSKPISARSTFWC